MLKKLSTFSLAVTLLFSNNIIIAHASWFKEWSTDSIENTCEKINKCGRYKDVNCAIDAAQTLLRAKNRHYIRFDKVGQNCEYELRFWDYLAIVDFSNNVGGSLQAAKQGLAINEVLKNITAGVKSIFDTNDDMSEKITSYWYSQSKFTNLSLEQLKDVFAAQAREDQSRKITWTSVMGVVGLVGADVAGWFFPPAGIAVGWHYLLAGGAAVIGGGTSAGIADAVVDWFQVSSRSKKADEDLIKVKNYASVIESLLTNIESGNWKYADSVLAQVNSDPEAYEGVVNMLSSKINYSKDEKSEFEGRFNKLKLILDEKVKEHKKEGWY